MKQTILPQSIFITLNGMAWHGMARVCVSFFYWTTIQNMVCLINIICPNVSGIFSSHSVQQVYIFKIATRHIRRDLSPSLFCYIRFCSILSCSVSNLILLNLLFFACNEEQTLLGWNTPHILFYFSDQISHPRSSFK